MQKKPLIKPSTKAALFGGLEGLATLYYLNPLGMRNKFLPTNNQRSTSRVLYKANEPTESINSILSSTTNIPDTKNAKNILNEGANSISDKIADTFDTFKKEESNTANKTTNQVSNMGNQVSKNLDVNSYAKPNVQKTASDIQSALKTDIAPKVNNALSTQTKDLLHDSAKNIIGDITSTAHNQIDNTLRGPRGSVVSDKLHSGADMIAGSLHEETDSTLDTNRNTSSRTSRELYKTLLYIIHMSDTSVENNPKSTIFIVSNVFNLINGELIIAGGVIPEVFYDKYNNNDHISVQISTHLFCIIAGIMYVLVHCNSEENTSWGLAYVGIVHTFFARILLNAIICVMVFRPKGYYLPAITFMILNFILNIYVITTRRMYCMTVQYLSYSRCASIMESKINMYIRNHGLQKNTTNNGTINNDTTDTNTNNIIANKIFTNDDNFESQNEESINKVVLPVEDYNIKEAVNLMLESQQNAYSVNDYEEGLPDYDDMLLPPGWKRFYDKRSNSFYYYNNNTQETSWDHPATAV